MIPGPACQGYHCGVELTDENTVCADCDRCHDCMPGTCWTCVELRREDAAAEDWRWFREHIEAVAW